MNEDTEELLAIMRTLMEEMKRHSEVMFEVTDRFATLLERRTGIVPGRKDS
jgi:hypothetical protein